MRTEVSVDIDAPPERVWEVISDVESWPQWTKSVSEIDKLTDGPLAKGSRVRIVQPKVPPVVWTVTAIEPGRSFEWEASSPALLSVAGHRIEPAEGGSRVWLTVEQTGPLTLVVGWWLRRISRKYIEMEAQGLKARAEIRDGYMI